MSDHIVMPPLVIERFAEAFDVTWLQESAFAAPASTSAGSGSVDGSSGGSGSESSGASSGDLSDDNESTSSEESGGLPGRGRAHAAAAASPAWADARLDIDCGTAASEHVLSAARRARGGGGAAARASISEPQRRHAARGSASCSAAGASPAAAAAAAVHFDSALAGVPLTALLDRLYLHPALEHWRHRGKSAGGRGGGRGAAAASAAGGAAARAARSASPLRSAAMDDRFMLEAVARLPPLATQMAALEARFKSATALAHLLPRAPHSMHIFPLPVASCESGGGGEEGSEESACLALGVVSGSGPHRGGGGASSPASPAQLESEGGTSTSEDARAVSESKGGSDEGSGARHGARGSRGALLAAAASAAPHAAAAARRLPPRDCVLRVAVYVSDDKVRKHSLPMAPVQEFEVLASTTLRALCDAVFCGHAGVLPGSAARRARMLFVEGVCYDDNGRSGGSGDDEFAGAIRSPSRASAGRGKSAGSSSGGGGGGALAAAPALSPPPRASAASSLMRFLLGSLAEGGADAAGAAEAAAGGSAAAAAAPPGEGGSAAGETLGESVALWASESLRRGVSSGWGPIQARPMLGVAVRALCPRLGAHYLLMHEGACEHILVFLDCCLLGEDEAAAAAGGAAHGGRGFPRLLSRQRYHRRRCGGCSAEPAQLRVVGDVLSGENPAYYCRECYARLYGRGMSLRRRPPASSAAAAAALDEAELADCIVLPYRHDPTPIPAAPPIG